jgi:hypothetical protein
MKATKKKALESLDKFNKENIKEDIKIIDRKQLEKIIGGSTCPTSTPDCGTVTDTIIEGTGINPKDITVGNMMKK